MATATSILGTSDTMATVAVKDLDRARRFYEDVLGLSPVQPERQHVVIYNTGSSKLLVYPSQFAGTNKATTATWTVDDIEATVRALKDHGVTFEHYDLPGLQRKGDIYRGGDILNAWFKDPDGNILSVVSPQ